MIRFFFCFFNCFVMRSTLNGPPLLVCSALNAASSFCGKRVTLHRVPHARTPWYEQSKLMLYISFWFLNGDLLARPFPVAKKLMTRTSNPKINVK